MYGELLLAIEASGLAQTARSSSWLYPLANLSHVLGVALLVGSIAVFDILLLRRRYAAAAGASLVALPLAACAILLIAASGSVMFSAEASAVGRNPAFLTKMALLVAGLANLAVYHLSARKLVGNEEFPPSARLHAGVSLGVWSAALLAGRSIAYL